MGTINIYSGNGANKAGLIYNGSGDITVDTEHLANISSDVQAQIDTKVPINNAQFTGNVGIGTTLPGETLEVNGNMFINVASGNPNLTIKTAGAGNNPFARLQADSTYWDILGVFSSADDPLHFQYGGSDKMILTNGGTLGLGVTPGSWSANYPALQIGGGATFTGHRNNTQTQLGQNWWVGTGNQYVVDGAASRLIMNPDSTIKFSQAPSGTAGATMSTTYDRLTIDPSGNVGIGTSSLTDKFEIHHNDAYEFSLKFNQGNSNIVPGFGQQQSILAYADGASNTDQYYAGITFGLWDATHNSKDGSIHFHTAVNGTVTTGLRITGTGEVLAALEPTLNMAVGTTNASHAKLTVASGMGDKPALLLTNADGGANAYANRNNRYLTSNGSNWIVDGKDPIAVIGIDSNSTDKFPSNGLVMHNESQTDNTFSPPIMFGNRSNSGAYNTAYAYIAGRKTGQGVDSNWSTGELWIDTAGTKHNGNNQYMDHSPAIKIRNTGTVDMRWQPFSYGTFSGALPANNTGYEMSPQVTQGLVYNNNSSHGWGFTVAEPGYYQCFATALYSPGANGYVYLGWCLNGASQHHWHSNHGIESNHDFVSSMIRWCNTGDHLTIENVGASVGNVWGGSHSQYHIWKVG